MAEPARKIEYTQSRWDERPRSPAPAKNKKRTKNRKKSGYVVEIQGSGTGKSLRVLMYMTILIGALLCVFSVAYRETRKHELSALDRQLNQLRIENNVLRSQIHDTFDLMEVENYALNVLGMVRPSDSQFVYVEPIRQGYAIRNLVEEEEINPLDIIGDMFRTLFGLIRAE